MRGKHAMGEGKGERITVRGNMMEGNARKNVIVWPDLFYT